MPSEDLGGGDVHTRLSGAADHLAENDEHALLIARNIVANLNYPKQSLSKEFDEPLFDSDELYGVVPGDAKTPFDIREVIMRLTDGSRFDEIDMDNYDLGSRSITEVRKAAKTKD